MQQLQSIEQFRDKIKTGKTIFLFTADWCPDCRAIEPELPEIEQKYDQFSFIHIDRDLFIDICQEYDVFGIPSFIAFHDGEEIGRLVNKDRKTKEEIESFIESLD
ncbi:thioredoxin family protein [Aquibacillus sediminis]|uniref:thioredoxin family protein n=1 Tax=Aquibacillus sediminis TaxID=2574734 RepID=UPI001107C61B|nr:thioredoxin family protein [Aquibacillus sediminis]